MKKVYLLLFCLRRLFLEDALQKAILSQKKLTGRLILIQK